MNTPTTSAAVTGIGQVAITVTDLDASVAFYRDVLGLAFLFAVPDQHMAFLDGGGVRLYLSAEAEAEVVSRPLLYWRVDDLDAAHAAVVAAGAEVRSDPHLVHRDAVHELWMSFVADPDGTLVGLMQERPLASG
jgi:catechol 2,3-dioxygenase-like lactoylglutathione lyase family enzyme